MKLVRSICGIFSVIWGDCANMNCRHLSCVPNSIWDEIVKFSKALCSLMSNTPVKSWKTGAGYRPWWGLTSLCIHPLQVTVFVWERQWPRWSFSSFSAASCRNSSSLYQKELRKSTQTLSLGAPWNPIHTNSVQFCARLLSIRDLRGTDAGLVVC